MHADLLQLARDLADQQGESSAAARRAISTAYYAFFHALSGDFADLLVGDRESQPRVWAAVYRQLDHGVAKAACLAGQNSDERSRDMKAVADGFVLAQRRRHEADYDPFFKVDEISVRGEVETVARSIRRYFACSEADRRAFAVHLLFRRRV